MLTAAAFVPSPPLLVPELVGLAIGETDEMRRAALGTVADIADVAEWIVVGAGRDTTDIPSGAVGTFAGFGADVTVRLEPGGDRTGADAQPDPRMPLVGLIAGWLREHAAPHVRADVRVLDAGTPPPVCGRLGASLRARIDGDPTPRALLIVADGAATLTPKAPGAFDPRSGAVEAALTAALAAGDAAALAELDPCLCADIALEGRAAWQVLAGAFGVAPTSVDIAYSGAPYGVGYHMGTWWP